MNVKELRAEDLWPLVSKLDVEERMRLFRMALLGCEVAAGTGAAGPYPLHGLPVIYEDPFSPVADSDWESVR